MPHALHQHGETVDALAHADIAQRQVHLHVAAGLVADVGCSQRAGVQPASHRRQHSTTVIDGFLPIDPKLLPKSTPEEVAPLLDRAGLPQGPVRASINTYVVDLPDQRVLIDAGLGPA